MDISQTDLENDPVYQAAYAELCSFGFHQKEKIGDLFPTVYLLMKDPKNRRYYPYLEVIWKWFLVSSIVWPGEFIPIAAHLVQLVQTRSPLSPALILIFKFARNHPHLQMQEMGKRRQNKAHKGEYDDLLKDDSLYVARNEEVLADPELRKNIEMMYAVFDMKSFANEIGVVRRYVVGERGYRVEWKFDPNNPESLMRTALTFLSCDYDLYGLQDGVPLVAKFTACPTGFGTVIMAPKYLVTDIARDLNRKAFGEFPKGFGVARKRTKALLSKRQREDEAIRTYTASLRADERGYEGPERREYIIKEAGLPPGTRRRKIRKLVAMAKLLLGVEE